MVWLGPASEHFTVHAVEEAGHEVLRAHRTPSEPMPLLPDELTRWVDVSEKALPKPRLREHGPHGSGVVGIEEVPEKRERFARWRREWETWAAAERARRARAAVHDELFRLHRVAEDRPESVEIVLAGGLLHLPALDTGSVHVHLVNQPVDLTREAATGDMVATLTEAHPRLVGRWLPWCRRTPARPGGTFVPDAVQSGGREKIANQREADVIAGLAARVHDRRRRADALVDAGGLAAR